MRVSVRLLPAMLLSVMSVTAAAAQKGSSSSDLSIGVRFGTLGIGPEVAKLLTPHIGIRAGANFFSYNATKTSSDISFDGSLKMQGVDGLLDLFLSPRGSFHFSGGVITSPAKITGTGVPSSGSTFEINKQTYNASDVGALMVKGEWPSASPYVGFGWGTPANKHRSLSFKFDLGVAIGKPTVTLTATNPNNIQGITTSVGQEQDTIQAKLDKYAKVYPVMQFGLVFRF